MVPYLEDLAGKNEPIDSKHVMTNFTSDVIATCGFGIEANCFSDPNSVFLKMASKLIGKEQREFGIIKMMMMFMSPKLSNLFGLQFLDPEATEFFASIIRETMAFRKTNNGMYGDLLYVCSLLTPPQEVLFLENFFGKILINFW